MNTSRLRSATAIAAVSLFALAGCGGSDDSTSATTDSAQNTASSSEQTGQTSESPAATESGSSPSESPASSAASPAGTDAATPTQSSAAPTGPSVSTADLDGKLLPTYQGKPIRKLTAAQLSQAIGAQTQMMQQAKISPAACATALRSTTQPTKMAGGAYTIGGTQFVVSLIGDKIDQQLSELKARVKSCANATMELAGQRVQANYKLLPAPSVAGASNVSLLQSTIKVGTRAIESRTLIGEKNGVAIQTVVTSTMAGLTGPERNATVDLFKAQAARL